MEKKLIKAALETALQYGGEFAEVYWEHKESTSVSLDGGKVEKINTGIDHGIGIRVITGDNTAYAYTNDLSAENVQQVEESLWAVSGQ